MLRSLTLYPVCKNHSKVLDQYQESKKQGPFMNIVYINGENLVWALLRGVVLYGILFQTDSLYNNDETGSSMKYLAGREEELPLGAVGLAQVVLVDYQYQLEETLSVSWLLVLLLGVKLFPRLFRWQLYRINKLQCVIIINIGQIQHTN